MKINLLNQIHYLQLAFFPSFSCNNLHLPPHSRGRVQQSDQSACDGNMYIQIYKVATASVLLEC